ncbi:hypothetical protein PG630_05740 [Riemerella anatipestifer]|nr:hypothetical protein [Riemerella anatipestifer]
MQSLKTFFYFLCLLWYTIGFAQDKQYFLHDTATKKIVIKNDSLSAVKFLDSLVEDKYYSTKLVKTEKTGNRIDIYFDKGQNYQQVLVKLSDSIANELGLKNTFVTTNLDSLKNTINKIYLEKGFAFNRIKSNFLGLDSSTGKPIASISVIKDKKRVIDVFKVKGYDKVPKRFIYNLEKEFKGKLHHSPQLIALHKRLQNHSFVLLERPPQTLFTPDSTQVFLFLQKKKNNSFDGVLGFGNNQSEKLTLNGTLNFSLKNLFNSFETLNLFWQRTPNSGQTFDVGIEIPYLFNSDIGTQLKMSVFRQDSTFAYVKVQPSLYYQWKFKHKIGVRVSFELSSVLSETYNLAREFSRKGVGLWYDYAENSDNELMPYLMKVNAEADMLNTQYTDGKASQWRYRIFAERNINLKGKHYLNLHLNSARLQTRELLSVNELYRIGGWNSLRGFNEESLLTNAYLYGGAEYRYLVGQQAFFDVFGQLAQVRASSRSIQNYFYSVGTGFNFRLPLGIMSFQISNGTAFGSPFRFKDIKIHWGLATRF